MTFLKQIISPIADLRAKNSINSELETQCLFGEKVEIISSQRKWVFCKTIFDSYEGWLEEKNISDPIISTHKVVVPSTFIYEKPSIKSKIKSILYYLSEVKLLSQKENWTKIRFNNKDGFIFTKHLNLKEYYEKDWLKISQKFIGSPYLWGGKSYKGIDCSALVQLSLLGCGIKIPRNSINQMKEKNFNLVDISDYEPGCLIFWKGHVAIYISKNKIIHSNAYHMCVVEEKLNIALNRINYKYGDIIKIKKVRI